MSSEFEEFEDFEEFLKERISGTSRRFSTYCGITRKSSPKWPGFNILKDMECPKEEDPRLDILVRNFYFIEYLKNKYPMK